MNAEQMDRRLNEIKKQIADLGIAIPGSIQTMYLRCGKKNCRCHQVKDQRHGPYYLWYRRIDGKTTTQSVAQEDLHLYRSWIGNKEKMESLMQKIVSIGADYAAVFKTSQDKSKNSLTRMRGK
jgi:hypothetical protein